MKKELNICQELIKVLNTHDFEKEKFISNKRDRENRAKNDRKIWELFGI